MYREKKKMKNYCKNSKISFANIKKRIPVNYSI